MHYWILEAAFIPLVLIIAKLTYQRVTLAEGRSVGNLIGGIVLLTIGVLFCYMGISSVIDSGEFTVATRRFSVDAHQSREPILYWSLVVLGYGFSVLFSWMGSLIILPYLLRGRTRPLPWKKEHSQWQGQTSFLTSKASFNVIAKAMVIEKIRPRSTALTAYQLHDFLWQTKQQFPEREIWLPRTPLLDPLIAILAQAGCLNFNTTLSGRSSQAFIRQVTDPSKSRPYEKKQGPRL